MCSNFLVGLFGAVSQKLVGNINYNNNKNNENDEQMLHYECSIEKSLESFNENDKIFEEFILPTNSYRELLLEENYEETTQFHNKWKKYRTPRVASWLLSCFAQSINMVVLGSLLVSALSVLIMYVHINTAEVCFKVQWDKLPEKVKRVRVTVQVIEGFFLQFFHIGVMIFVFGFKLIDKLHLLHLNVVAAFVDSVYRLFFQVYNNYDWKGEPYILNVIFVVVMLVNSYTLAKHFSKKRGRKFILTLQLAVQFMLGSAVIYFNGYFFDTWFIRLERFEQRIVAASVPIIGVIIKLFSRLTIQNIQINHPGTSYMLLACAYIGTSLYYRTIQAEIQKTTFFILLCVIHSTIGLCEKLVISFYQPFSKWFCTEVLKRNGNSIHDPTKTPRSQRLMADIFICNMISDTNAVIYTNAFVQLYALQVGGDKIDKYELLKDFSLRTIVAIIIEYVFSAFGIFIFTWFKNIPIIRVWRKKWKTILALHLFIGGNMVLYSTQYLTIIVAGQYGDNRSKNETLTCDSSIILI